MKKTLSLGAIPFVVASFVHFAASAEEVQANKTATMTTQATTSETQGAMNDGQIADVMKTVNDAEIDAAKLAKSKASNDQVKEFAKNMIDEHKKNEKDGKHVAKKADMKKDSSDMSKSIKEDAKNKMAALKKLKGPEFDQIYMDQQVTMHQQVLNDLDQKYIPSAKDAQMKDYLRATREHVANHLAKAKEIQSTLAK